MSYPIPMLLWDRNRRKLILAAAAKKREAEFKQRVLAHTQPARPVQQRLI